MLRGQFKRKSFRDAPAISTASLPDIIFILLFFFMVSTHLKRENASVKVAPPGAHMADVITNPTNVSYIFVGPPADTSRYGTAPRVQLNGQLATLEEVGSFAAAELSNLMTTDKEEHIFVLNIDRSVPYQVVEEVKEQLRLAGGLNVRYTVSGKRD